VQGLLAGSKAGIPVPRHWHEAHAGILKIFRQMGALSATLEVRVSNKKAQALYSTLGFQMIGMFHLTIPMARRP